MFVIGATERVELEVVEGKVETGGGMSLTGLMSEGVLNGSGSLGPGPGRVDAMVDIISAPAARRRLLTERGGNKDGSVNCGSALARFVGSVLSPVGSGKVRSGRGSNEDADILANRLLAAVKLIPVVGRVLGIRRSIPGCRDCSLFRTGSGGTVCTCSVGNLQ